MKAIETKAPAIAVITGMYWVLKLMMGFKIGRTVSDLMPQAISQQCTR